MKFTEVFEYNQSDMFFYSSKLDKVSNAFASILQGNSTLHIKEGTAKIKELRKDSEYSILLSQYISQNSIGEKQKKMGILQLTKLNRISYQQIQIITPLLQKEYIAGSEKIAQLIRKLLIKNAHNYSVSLFSITQSMGDCYTAWSRIIALGVEYLQHIENFDKQKSICNKDNFEQLQILIYRTLRLTRISQCPPILDRLMSLFHTFKRKLQMMRVKYPSAFEQYEMDFQNWRITFSFLNQQIQVGVITKYVVELFFNQKNRIPKSCEYLSILEETLFAKQNWCLQVLHDYYTEQINYQKVLNIYEEVFRTELTALASHPSDIFQCNDDQEEKNQDPGTLLNKVIQLNQKEISDILRQCDIHTVARLLTVLSFWTPPKFMQNFNTINLLKAAKIRCKQYMETIFKTQRQTFNNFTQKNKYQQFIGVLKFFQRNNSIFDIEDIIFSLAAINKSCLSNYKLSGICYAFINQQVRYLQQFTKQKGQSIPAQRISDRLFQIIQGINKNQWGITAECFQAPLVMLQNIKIKFFHESIQRFFDIVISTLYQSDNFNTEIANLAFSTMAKVHKDNLEIKSIDTKSIKQMCFFMIKNGLSDQKDQDYQYLSKQY